MKSAIVAAAFAVASFISAHASEIPATTPIGSHGAVMQADTAKHRKMTINARQQRQKRRIKDGMKDGELTQGETVKLVKGQREIRKDEAAARADGTVTVKERVKLQRELDRQSRAIHHQKHDKQGKGGGTGSGQ